MENRDKGENLETTQQKTLIASTEGLLDWQLIYQQQRQEEDSEIVSSICWEKVIINLRLDTMQKNSNGCTSGTWKVVEPIMFESQEGIKRKNGQHVSKPKQNFTFYNINN